MDTVCFLPFKMVFTFELSNVFHCSGDAYAITCLISYLLSFVRINGSSVVCRNVSILHMIYLLSSVCIAAWVRLVLVGYKNAFSDNCRGSSQVRSIFKLMLKSSREGVPL